MSVKVDIAYLFKAELKSDITAYDLVHSIECRISTMVSDLQPVMDGADSSLTIEEISVSYSDGDIDDNTD